MASRGLPRPPGVLRSRARVAHGARGVIDFEAFLKARQGAEWLTGSLHNPQWLKEAVVEPVDDGSARIVLLCHQVTEYLKTCMPTHIDGIEVVLRLVD